MLTRKFARKYINDFLVELIRDYHYFPQRVVLFGSVAKGSVHADSDIDLAIWDEHFEGCRPIDCEPIKRLKSKYYMIELHTFEAGETAMDNPFIQEIEKAGIEIEIPISHSITPL